MPEYPEVELLKQYCDLTCLHQEIESVELREKIILEEGTIKDFERGLVGRSFETTCRHGKYLFLKLDDEGWLVLHFGMTGDLQYFKGRDQEPDYVQLLIEFANGYHLGMIMPRKLGKVRQIADAGDYIRWKGLGPDVMAQDFDLQAFLNALEGRRGMIKSALMNQEIMAGVGNVYSDEILFQARVHPKAKVNDLDQVTLRRIFDCLKDILGTLVDVRLERDKLPRNYLLPVRGAGEQCPYCQGEVKNIKVSGRSAYYCSSCQKMPG
jgi:formamidopyrimidine-DNA glycosylase